MEPRARELNCLLLHLGKAKVPAAEGDPQTPGHSRKGLSKEEEKTLRFSGREEESSEPQMEEFSAVWSAAAFYDLTNHQ